jgi:tRNA pseudouridine38-40 synthase
MTGSRLPLDRNLRMTICYDGGRYKGWQRLGGDEPTIQGKIEAVLSRLLEEDIRIIGAGRTDSGVHAEGQVANFLTSSPMPAGDIIREGNSFLPNDIAIISCVETDTRFNARYAATGKTYRYRIVNRPIKDPFLWQYALWEKEPLDIASMKAAAVPFLGSHDFRSFTTLKEKDKSCQRTIRSVSIENRDGLVDILFNADGFLWNQVRIMTTALIEAGKGRLSAGEIASIIEKRERAAAPGLADARGLCLVSVEYK